MDRKCATNRANVGDLLNSFFLTFSAFKVTFFYNKYSQKLSRMKLPHCSKQINQFTIIYKYVLIYFDQRNITLFIFFNNWVNRIKRNFLAGRAVLSCMVLRIVENISLSVQSILYNKYDLSWHFFTTYFEVKGLTTLDKIPRSPVPK